MDRRRWWAGGVFALSVAMLGLALWLFTLDVYADHGRHYAGEARSDGARSFCGSAYDVALLRGDGFMGGEMPMNQELLNEECVTKASRAVAMSSAAAVSGLALLLFGAGITRSAGRGPDGRRDVSVKQRRGATTAL